MAVAAFLRLVAGVRGYPSMSRDHSTMPEAGTTADPPARASARVGEWPSIGSIPIDRYGVPDGQPHRLRHIAMANGGPVAWSEKVSRSSPSATVIDGRSGMVIIRAVPSASPSFDRSVAPALGQWATALPSSELTQMGRPSGA